MSYPYFHLQNNWWLFVLISLYSTSEITKLAGYVMFYEIGVGFKLRSLHAYIHEHLTVTGDLRLDVKDLLLDLRRAVT